LDSAEKYLSWVPFKSKSQSKPKRPPARSRKVFGLALKEARANLGISQEQLALDAGVNRTYVTDIERGTRNVALDNLERLADAVNLPLWKMLEPPSE
jgi:DNA-binding XRE family transcriptional regulator